MSGVLETALHDTEIVVRSLQVGYFYRQTNLISQPAKKQNEKNKQRRKRTHVMISAEILLAFAFVILDYDFHSSRRNIFGVG
jgi:hypothetical protein